jgi:hypothetical protein
LAQHSRIELKNGDILKGKILEQTDTHLKVRLSPENILRLSQTEIQQIIVDTLRFPARKGYHLQIMSGVLLGKSHAVNEFTPERNFASFSFHIFQGYRFHHAFSLGATTGLDYYQGIAMMPLALTIQGDISNRCVTPFYDVSVGIATNWLTQKSENQSVKGGFFFAPQVGLKFHLAGQSAFLLSVGYQQQRVVNQYEQWWGTWIEEKINFRRLSLRIGASF